MCILKIKKRFLIIIGLLLVGSFFTYFVVDAMTHSCHGCIPRYQMVQYDRQIKKLYATVSKSHFKNMSIRVAADSRYFLSKPYVSGSLGEGSKGQFDKNPLYRTDQFDCMTYVSTVLALSESNNLKEFKRNILRVRYENNVPRFLYRNHFASVDWNKKNSRNGYLQDVTHKIVDRKGLPVAVVAETIIDKPNWYKKLKSDQIKYFRELSSKEREALLTRLRNLGRKTVQEKSVILYLPMNKLFKNGKPNQFLFKQIPSGSVIEIVRPNWNLVEELGTHWNVSHMGLAVRTSKGLMFREASSSDFFEEGVIDVPLTDYLKHYLNSPTIKGINVQRII